MDQSPAAGTAPADEARHRNRWGPQAVLLALYVYSGYSMQALPVSAPALLGEWNIPARELATPQALFAVGMAAGALLGGFLGDARGRRLPVIGFAALQGLAVLATAFIDSLTPLYFLTLVNGLCLGGYFAIGMALMTELTAVHRRGLLISLAILAGPVGLGLCSLAGSAVIPAHGWEAMFLIGGAAAIPLVAALLVLLPESPGYLAKFPARSEERRELMQRLGLTGEEDEGPAAPGQQRKPAGSTVSALLRDRLGATLGLWAVFFLMYLLGSAVLSWVPVVFDTLGLGLVFASQSLFYWTIGSLVGTPLSGWAIGRLGVHRVALLFGTGMVVAIALMVLALSGRPSGQAMMLLLPLAGFTVAGVVTSLYTLAAQTYPAAVRGTGIGLADAAGRVGGIAAAYAGVYALEQGGARGFFLTVLGLAVASVVVLALLWLGHRRTVGAG